MYFRFRLPLLGLAVFAATCACGAAAAPTPPAPRPSPWSPAAATADEPLVSGNVETEADAARVLRENYTKYEYRIPMRDGTRLFTNAYVPKDALHAYPI